MLKFVRLQRKSTNSWLDYELPTPLKKKQLNAYLAKEFPGWEWVSAAERIDKKNDD